MKPQRWWFWCLPLFLIATLVGAEVSGWSFLRGPMEAVLASRLGREVRIAPPFQLHFRDTIKLRLGGLWVSAPPEYAVPHLVDAQGLTLNLPYADLFALRQPTQPLRLAALTADALDVQLIRLGDGRASWHFASESRRPPPTIGYLGVRQGHVVLRDPILAADLVSRFAPGTREGAPITQVDIAGRFRERPLRASIALLGGLPQTLSGTPAAPIAAEGGGDYGGLHLVFSGTLGVDAWRGALAIRGKSLSLLGRLFDTTLPTTAPFSLQASVVKDSPIWQITVTRARVGKSDLAGSFSFDTRPQPHRLEGKLTGRNFVLADLAPAFGTRTTDGDLIRPPRGRTLPHRPLDLPSLRRLDAHIAIDLAQVDLGSAFRQPIAPLRASLTLDGGRLTLADIDASTARGHLGGRLSIDARLPRPEWRADLAWSGVRLDQWIKAAKAGVDDRGRQSRATPLPWFTGNLQGRTQFVGQGLSTAELLGSLDGRATFFVSKGSLSHLALEALGLDVAQGLGLLLTGDDLQPLECAVIDVDARHGRITPRMAALATPVTVVRIDGSIDLAQEQLNLRLAAEPQNVSPLTLRSPFHLTGSFAAPKLTPAVGPIAARAAGAVGLAMLNPFAAILPFVDPGERDTTACRQALVARRTGNRSAISPSNHLN
ncbi:MAG TPA: AsmA family protein [Azospira sp.]|nr:AsmA family protein [Azospira sp.]